MNKQMTAPTWEHAVEIYNDMQAIGSQAVLRACDLGDTLRELRLLSDSDESFRRSIYENFSKQPPWAITLMTLSFRRDKVLKYLGDGSAEGRTAMYERIRHVPASAEEATERAKWPKAQRGPEKGTTYKPKDTKPVVKSIPAEKGKATKAAKAADKAKSDLSMTAQQKFDKAIAAKLKEMQAQFNVEIDAALKAEREALAKREAEVETLRQEYMKQKNELTGIAAVRKKQSAFRGLHEFLNGKEAKTIKSALHPDREASEQVKNTAFKSWQKLELLLGAI